MHTQMNMAIESYVPPDIPNKSMCQRSKEWGEASFAEGVAQWGHRDDQASSGGHARRYDEGYTNRYHFWIDSNYGGFEESTNHPGWTAGKKLIQLQGLIIHEMLHHDYSQYDPSVFDESWIDCRTRECVPGYETVDGNGVVQPKPSCANI